MKMSDREQALITAIDALLDEYSDVASAHGVLTLAAESGHGDDITTAVLDESRRDHYRAGWAMVLEYVPLDPDGNNGSFTQIFSPRSMSAMHVTGLLRNG